MLCASLSKITWETDKFCATLTPYVTSFGHTDLGGKPNKIMEMIHVPDFVMPLAHSLFVSPAIGLINRDREQIGKSFACLFRPADFDG